MQHPNNENPREVKTANLNQQKKMAVIVLIILESFKYCTGIEDIFRILSFIIKKRKSKKKPTFINNKK